MSSFKFPIKSQPSLFTSSDIPNEKFIQDQIEYRDRYKNIKIPVNVLAGKWILSPNKKLKVMTDTEFKISYYGEMMDFDEKWVLSLIEKENINLLVYEIQQLVEYIIKKNKVNILDGATEALVRRNMSSYINIISQIGLQLGDGEMQTKCWNLFKKLFA